MEQCWGEATGILLLQRWKSSAVIADAVLPHLSENIRNVSSLLTASQLAAISPSLAQVSRDNASWANASLVSKYVTLPAHSRATSYSSVLASHLADRFTNITNFTNITGTITNITNYEDNLKEIGSALLLNLGVFFCGLALWALIVFIKALWQGKADESGDSSHQIAADRTPLDVHAETPKNNYLMYMLVCMYMCIVISFVNLCFLLPHGLAGKLLFGGWSILMVLGQISFAEIYLITFIDGCIVIAFTELFKQLIDVPETDMSKDRLRRTVWMQGLPTHDSMRWWKRFRLNPLEVVRVRHDLMEALTDVLHVPPQSSAAVSNARIPQAAEGGIGCAPPATPPPLDLQKTSWRCHIDGGNPYYVNLTTAAVQWELPAELSTWSHPVDSLVIEEIQVALVIDDWSTVHTELQRAKEYLEAYEAKSEKANCEIVDDQRPLVLRLMLWPAIWWYERRIAWLRPLIDTLAQDLDALREEKKALSGSAFITFKLPRHRDQLLQEEEGHPVTSWIWKSSHSYFSFGRPPFASVTLSCERAPHPSDIIWQNLHITWWQRSLVFWSLASLLLFVMVVLVTVVRISELVMPIMHIVRKELHALEHNYIWQHFVPSSPKTLVETLNHDNLLWKSLLEQIPTLILLFINSVMVPALITAITYCERAAKLSDAEISRMMVNFFFLFTNTVIVPFCGVASLSELLEKFFKALQEQASSEPLRKLIFASPGVFALKYLMSATFISSINQLLQVPQITVRWFQMNFLAVTNRDKKKFQEPWPFYWGYWYAWTLSIFALGLIMSVACPSTLPIAALFFFVKYWVDKYNLNNSVYACGTDVEGGLAIRVVYYLRFVVAFWWFAMGAMSCAISMLDPQSNLTLVQKLWLRRGGVVLMVLGSITFGWSWWLKAQHLLRLRLHGARRSPLPSLWEDVGEALHLKTRQKGGQSSASPPSVDSVANGTKKKVTQPMSWNGAKLQGLE
jgi:hypothetical protein